MIDITVEPFGHSYECGDGQTLLEAALRQNLLLRYGCKHGGCGSCKVRLVDGDVSEHGSSFALTEHDPGRRPGPRLRQRPAGAVHDRRGAEWAIRGGVLLRGHVP